MNRRTNFLLSVGFIRLTAERVAAWIEDKKVAELEYALLHGTYQIRVQSVQGLSSLRSKTSLPLVIAALDDVVKPVSLAAMDAIEVIGSNSDLIQMVQDKREFWRKKELKEKESAKLFLTKRIPKSYSPERGTKKTLEHLRNMLRKPMLGGKWF